MLAKLNIVPSDKALVFSPELVLPLALQGAMVVFVHEDPGTIEKVRAAYRDDEDSIGQMEGHVYFVEGKFSDLSVQGFLKQIGPFDHLILPGVGRDRRPDAQDLARVKSMDDGSLYLGPFAEQTEWRDCTDQLRAAGFRWISTYWQAHTPGSARYDSRIYSIGPQEPQSPRRKRQEERAGREVLGQEAPPGDPPINPRIMRWTSGIVRRVYSPDEVRRYVTPEILLLFEVAQQLGIPMKITGGTARDFAAALVARKRFSYPHTTDADVLIPLEARTGAPGEFNEAAYARFEMAFAAAFRERFPQRPPPVIDPTHGRFVVDGYIYEHFRDYQPRDDDPDAGEAYSISRLGVEQTAEGFVVEGPADAFADLDALRLRIIASHEESLTVEALAKMLGRWTSYQSIGFARPGHDERRLALDFCGLPILGPPLPPGEGRGEGKPSKEPPWPRIPTKRRRLRRPLRMGWQKNGDGVRGFASYYSTQSCCCSCCRPRILV